MAVDKSKVCVSKSSVKLGDKINIVSDGTMVGTKVFDAEGKPIGRIQRVELIISVDDPIPSVKLTVLCPKVNVSGAKVSEICTPKKAVYTLGSEGVVDVVPDPI
jgi:hypothetical protein